jgi:hypothetical protein
MGSTSKQHHQPRLEHMLHVIQKSAAAAAAAAVNVSPA